MESTATVESPLKRAAKTARIVARSALQDASATAEGARTELNDLLPIEQGKKGKIEEMATRNTRRVAVLAAIYATDVRYLEFPIESMRWRENGFPALVPFKITMDTVTFTSFKTIGDKIDWKIENVPECVIKIYEDVAGLPYQKLSKEMRERAKHRITFRLWASFAVAIAAATAFVPGSAGIGWRIALGVIISLVSGIAAKAISDHRVMKRCGKAALAYKISARFDGLIPERIRQKIRRAQSLGIFKEIFILAEVPGLAIEESEMPKPAQIGDPLVIGFDGSGFWLIAAFDTSPVEAMALATTVKV
jgi:hypothetical protein